MRSIEEMEELLVVSLSESEAEGDLERRLCGMVYRI
jgi:hypothetical protein